MNNNVLQLIYRSVVIAKLLYAASEWWGYTSANDRQRLAALIKPVRSGLRSDDTPSLAEMVDSADEAGGALFQRILYNPIATSWINSFLIGVQLDTTLKKRKRQMNRVNSRSD